ncbi:MAG: hypothetical protein QM703_06270 [Gemmatales bacterium]
MQRARCPYCQQKLDLPDDLAPGVMLQCAECGKQFLPPSSIKPQSDQPIRRKKRRKARTVQRWTRRSIILVTSLASIVLLIGTLLLLWLMQPGYSKFNDQLSAQYDKFSTIIAQHVSPKPINNLTVFLKQFEKIGPQLKDLQVEVKSIRAPEDQKPLLNSLTTLIDSMTRFSQSDVPRFLEELKKKPNNEATATEMVQSLMEIAAIHESLVAAQNSMAMQHQLTMIRPRADAPFFFTPPRR